MKKFAKITSITALVLFLLGIVLATIGLVGGGRKVLRQLAAEGLLSFGEEDFGLHFSLDEDEIFHEKYTIYSGGEHRFDTEGQKINKLIISLSGGEVSVEQGDEDYWQVQAEGFGRFQVFAEGDTLHVAGTGGKFDVHFGEVTIFAPQGHMLDQARIELGAGEMEIECLAAGEMELSVGAGTLYVEELQADRVKAGVGAGEILVESGRMGDVNASVGMGTMELSGEMTGNLEGSVSMGELQVLVHGSEEEDHNYKLSCAAGEMRVGSAYYAGLGNSREIDNGADTTYELDCSMGSLEVDFK